MLWDCKVTPAYCACQEVNTIGCILSNDGLGAGVRGWFSTTVVSGQWSVKSPGALGLRRRTGAKAHIILILRITGHLSAALPGLCRHFLIVRESEGRGWGRGARGKVGEICR